MDGQVNLEAIKNVGKVDALSAVYKGKWIKILAYPAILRFKKRHPKQKYCCVTKSNLLSKKKWAGYATAIEPYVEATIKTWPAKYKTLTETENSLKTQAFSALTSCCWKTKAHVIETQWPLLQFHRTLWQQISRLKNTAGRPRAGAT